MKTILAKVTTVRRTLDEPPKRKVVVEWKHPTEVWTDSMTLDDPTEEFQIGDEVGISINKVR